MSKEQWVKDDVYPWLYKRIAASGKASWVLYKHWKGRPLKIKISDCELMGELEARLEAVRLVKELQAGKDPIKEKREARKPELTLAALFEQYYDQHCVNNARPHEVRAGYELHWKTIRTKRIGSLESSDVQKWLSTLGIHSQSVANRQYNQLRACLSWGIRLKYMSGPNPCEGVAKFQTQERKVYLQPSQYAALKLVLDRKPGEVADAIWLLLFTAARKSNVIKMEWSEIDFEHRLWLIPARKAKPRKPLVLVLTTRALAVLNRRKHYQEHSPWVFPAADDPTKHRTTIDAAWRKLRKEAGLDHVHIHDLRHTMASWMGINNAPSFTIQRMLSHASSRTTEKYTHLNMHAVRVEAEKAQDKM